ncbi:MAG: T9SS type A sorting domain-containing protein [Chitinophagaceae bacterium]|nr:T9SS type A sorting domain-containing protein [Chitinophagaceae bacterium]
MLYTIILGGLLFIFSCNQKSQADEPDTDAYDGPAEIARFEFERTKDPATGDVPRARLVRAMRYTDSLKAELPFQVVAGYGNWEERGPNADVVGPSNGNTRANSGVSSGRIRAILVDASDVTGNTVFAGSVAGGLWKTTDITSSPANWTRVDDFLSNMAITSICQNPAIPATMYFCTGEANFNFDAVQGDGIFKSTDGGTTWSQLASTTGASFDYCSKILCDVSGNVYVSTRSGVFRSNDGGATWTTISPTGLATSRYSDMEISSTGRLHVSAGMFSTCAYRFTNNPATVTSAGWTAPTSGYPTSTVRIELGCSGDILYALPSGNSSPYQVATIYKSTDGGANWAATTAQPTAGWAGGQAWYSLGVDIDPANTDNVIVGGLEAYQTADGGGSWTRISRWVGTTGQYVHADIHFIKFYGTNRVLFGCDGGIHFSNNNGATIRDRNSGLRIKQFFSCAIHPSTTDYFLAGAQDNGCHKFTNAGLSSTEEFYGGDGAFVAIDQDQPQYQFGSYVYNVYRRSTNSGATWNTVTWSSSIGQFINPYDYDDVNNKIYAAWSANNYFRWDDPQTGATAVSQPLANLNGNVISAVKVSPYTGNLVYFGTDNSAAGCRLVKVANAHAVITETNISTGLPTAADVSCINVGSNDNNLIVSFSNYGIQQIWYSTNGGTSWTNIDGDLPDMPVRWCMFVPGNDNAAIIATEAGVYLTHLFAGGATAWIPSPTFPTVRTDMLEYRPSDGLVAAATHGRGLWTQPYLSIVPTTTFLLRGKWNGNTTDLQWEYTKLSAHAVMDIEYATDAVHFSKAGTVNSSNSQFYSFNYKPGQTNVYFRIKSTEANGLVKYSNTIKLFRSGLSAGLQITTLYPNPVQQELNLGVTASSGKIVYSIFSANGQVIWRKEEELQFTGNYIKTLNIAGIRPGNYVLSVSNGNTQASKQFIKR